MRHRCTIQRDGQATTDSFGHKAPAIWEAHLSSQPCRYWVQTAAVDRSAGIVATVAMHHLALPVGTDVEVGDRVTVIEDRRGTDLVGATMVIRTVVKRPDHLQCGLESVRGNEAVA